MNKVIFDIGTNSIKLFVYTCDKNTYSLKLKTKLGNRLGDYINEYDLISNDGIELTIQSIKKLLDIVKDLDHKYFIAYGTEVFRRAKNIDMVLDNIFDATSIKIDVISQEEEAEIFWKGLVQDFNWDKDIAAIDIGGGSVQFMYGNKTTLKKVFKLNTGALFLKNKFLKTDPANEDDYRIIEEYISVQIDKIDIKLSSDTPLIHGSTSVIDFFWEANTRIIPSALSSQHPFAVEINTLRELYYEMRLLPKEERSKYFPSQPEYTDGCCIGFANILAIAEKTGLVYELPSNNSIIQGFLI